MVTESGFTYNGKDPIFEMDSDEFEEMLKEFGIEIEHPKDLHHHSLDMWRAKWIFRILRKNDEAFEQDQEKVEEFKNSLV
jgi:beta-phosphoglucomutase-like phosphatase (HAD superfamily)